MDTRPIGPLSEYTLVTVYRPAGKRAFASIVYPGLLGCTSGINDAGLALAELTVTTAADDSPALNLAGEPSTLALHRVMEECRTVEEAEKLLRSLKRTIRQNVAICDQRRAVVFEITPYPSVSPVHQLPLALLQQAFTGIRRIVATTKGEHAPYDKDPRPGMLMSRVILEP